MLGPFDFKQQRERITALIIISLLIKRPILLSTPHNQKKSLKPGVCPVLCVHTSELGMHINT